jgi:hypothetical protein
MMQSQNSMSLNQLLTDEKISDKQKGKGASLLNKMAPKEYIAKTLHRIIEHAVEQSVLKTRIKEVHQFAVEFFGNCIESSINLDLMGSRVPVKHIETLREPGVLVEDEPKAVEFENWNRGCVSVIVRPSANLRSVNQTSAVEGDISSISFYGGDSSAKRRGSQARWLTRPSITSNRPSRMNITDNLLKAQNPIEEEPINLKKEELQVTGRLSISNISKRLIKLAHARSLSINSEKLEEELRQIKIVEFATNGQIGLSTFVKNKVNALSKTHKTLNDKGTSGNKPLERTFGLTGELQEIRTVKNDRIKSVFQHPKSDNKRVNWTLEQSGDDRTKKFNRGADEHGGR